MSYQQFTPDFLAHLRANGSEGDGFPRVRPTEVWFRQHGLGFTRQAWSSLRNGNCAPTHFLTGFVRLLLTAPPESPHFAKARHALLAYLRTHGLRNPTGDQLYQILAIISAPVYADPPADGPAPESDPEVS